jgi:valyl-tRNA synthetase
MASIAGIGASLKLSTERVKGYRNFGTKLWNATRFAEMNQVFDPATNHTQPLKKPDANHTLNKWIIGEIAKTRAEVDTALAAYRFNDAANALYSFVWGKFCDWYIEFSKPLFYSEDDEIIAETRVTMVWTLDQCLILLHPFMPFVTEELWNNTGERSKMLVHADWPTYEPADYVDENADREMNWVISLIEEIRSVRQQMHVPAGAKIPMLQLDLDANGTTAWERNAVLIKRLARIDSLAVVRESPKGAVTVTVTGGTFALPLADIIDIAEEKSRLEKTLEKLTKEINGMAGRLNNPKFVASAPDAVVAETRQNLENKQADAEKLQAALKRLADLG